METFVRKGFPNVLPSFFFFFFFILIGLTISSWSKSSELITLNRCPSLCTSNEIRSPLVMKLELLSTEFIELLLLLDSLATEQPRLLGLARKSPSPSKLCDRIFSVNNAASSSVLATEPFCLSKICEGKLLEFWFASREGSCDTDATTECGLCNFGLKSENGLNFEFISENEHIKV